MSHHSERIDSPESDYLYTHTSQIPDAGLGLYTAIPIYKDEIIAYYHGEILTHEEADRRAALKENQYFIVLLDGSIMDSKHVDCFAKYANDASDKNLSFKNNAKITLDEHDQVCLVATKNIGSNQEIFCAYGKKYWQGIQA